MRAQILLAAFIGRSVHGTMTHKNEPRSASAINIHHVVYEPVVLLRVFQKVVLRRHDNEVHRSVFVRIPQVTDTVCISIKLRPFTAEIYTYQQCCHRWACENERCREYRTRRQNLCRSWTNQVSKVD